MIGKVAQNLSAEQQELMDSGLRMLAQIIATAHLHRTASRQTGKGPLASAERKEYPNPKKDIHESITGDVPLENHHE